MFSLASRRHSLTSWLALRKRPTTPSAELAKDCVVFVARERIPRDGRYLRGRCQPRGAASDGSGTGRRDGSCETTTLQSTRYLPDDSAAPELVDDRTSDVALVPAAREPNTSQGSSSVVLRCTYASCGSGNDGCTSATLYRSRGGHRCSSG